MGTTAKIKILIRGDTAHNWEAINPVLGKNEMAIEWADDSPEKKIKIGDGVSRYNILPYMVDEQLIKTALEAEAASREEADTTLAGDLAAEAMARSEADEALSDRINAIDDTAIAAETAARGEADTALQEDIDTVAGDLTAEAAARGEADTALQEDIDTVAGDLAAETAARGEAEEALQGNIGTVAGDLAAEAAARGEADTALSDRIDTAQETAEAAQGTADAESERATGVEADIATELTQEAARALATEEGLQDAVDAARATADAALPQADVVAPDSSATAGQAADAAALSAIIKGLVKLASSATQEVFSNLALKTYADTASGQTKAFQLLGTAIDGTEHTLVELAEYGAVQQIEIGSETIHLNLNNLGPVGGDNHITCDTHDSTGAAVKLSVAWLTDVVTQCAATLAGANGYTDDRIEQLRVDALILQDPCKESQLPAGPFTGPSHNGYFYQITDFDLSYPGGNRKGSATWYDSLNNYYLAVDTYKNADEKTITENNNGEFTVADVNTGTVIADTGNFANNVKQGFLAFIAAVVAKINGLFSLISGLNTAIGAKYTKPAGGIPTGDLSLTTGQQGALNSGITAALVSTFNADTTKLDGIASGAQVNPAIATQAEAEAGTNNAKMMTALRVAQAIAKSVTTALVKLTGYSKPGSTSAIEATDSVNNAIGKLEKALDGKEATFGKNTAFNKVFETSASNIKANGTVSVGTSENVPRADHVHSTDTSRAPATTTLSDASASATLPSTSSTSIVTLIQMIRNNLKSLFSYFTNEVANSAAKLATAITIDGVSFDGSSAITRFGSCSTAAATVAKVVALAGFALVSGAEITVTFTATNTAANPTLNVNSTGAKPIYYRNAAISAGYLAANRTYKFVYDGAQYELVGDVDTNTTYSAATTAKAGLMSAEDKTKLNGLENLIGEAEEALQENIDGVAGDLANVTAALAALADENGAFGYNMEFEHEPTPLQLALWRCLPLQGQIVQISLYQRLCDAKYVGNAANATADWWYKTADPQGTVRDVNGAYMRVLDHRGVFTRPAGQNSLYKMANDTPYDGNDIGAFIGDAIRNIAGEVEAGLPGDVYQQGALKVYASNRRAAPLSGSTGWVLQFYSALVVPTALENRPASISAYLCIKY